MWPVAQRSSRVAVASVVVAAAALAAVVVARRHAASPIVRVAIRVDCERVGAPACAIAEQLALDTWSEARGPREPLDVVVTARTAARLVELGIAYDVLVPDIDADARAERERIALADASDFFADYRDFEAITAHLRELVALAPDRVSLHAIGASIDGRPLWALRIGTRGTPLLVDGTQHAREWIAAMTTTCIADRLVRDYDHDAAIRAFDDATVVWVVPVVNPDGYQYTWSGDRYWRKNRRSSYGVDLNRNFGVAFGGAGSSKNKRAENYRGEYAFSEPESAAIRDLAKREHVALHVDFHAYGQLVMYPWGYTHDPAQDRDRFAAIGDRMTSAMTAAHDTRYALMQASDLYPASGNISDWMYGEAGARSFAIELRPTGWPGRGKYGFVLPPEQIKPTCDEGLAAVLALRDAR